MRAKYFTHIPGLCNPLRFFDMLKPRRKESIYYLIIPRLYVVLNCTDTIISEIKKNQSNRPKNKSNGTHICKNTATNSVFLPFNTYSTVEYTRILHNTGPSEGLKIRGCPKCLGGQSLFPLVEIGYMI